MPSAEEILSFYSNGYHDNFNQSSMASVSFAQSRYRELESLLSVYSPRIANQRVRSLLDIGCGTGDFLKAAQDSGWNITGTEFSSEAVRHASHQTGCHIVLGDISTLDLQESSYDLVTSYHVIEHLATPIEQLNRCYQLVSSEGALFIETPNIDSLGARLRGANWSHIIPPEHLIYFSPKSLEFALREAGFKRVVVLTSAPQVIESIEDWPNPLKRLAAAVYSISPMLRMGAALQAIAFKS